MNNQSDHKLTETVNKYLDVVAYNVATRIQYGRLMKAKFN